MRTRPLPLLAALLAAGGAAAAEPAPPLTVPDLIGPRFLALQAGVGAASGTESLFLNPAALAARKRYTVDSYYLTDRRPELTGSLRRQDYIGGSVADSQTTRVAAAFGYARVLKGVETGTLLRLGLAGPLAQGLYLGAQANWFDLRGGERIASTFNVDTGLFYQVTRLVSVGASGYNLLSSKHRAVLPRGFGAGVAVGSETSLQLLADWRTDLDRVKDPSGGFTAGDKGTNRWAFGAEYLFANAIPVRAGFEIDDTSKTTWWSAGLGWTTTRGAIDLGWRQSATDARARTFGVAVRLFVPNE